MATLLSLIGENERFRIRPKNINGSDDVTENGFSSYLDDYGMTAIQDYSDDVNTESPSVSEVGDIALRDRKDYNAFPQDTYSEAEVERINVSVIDMPEIDEISEDVYISRTVYNKYSNLQYIPIEVLDAAGVQAADGTYGDYIQTILSNLEQRGNSLADIFIGQWNLDDSPIGVIGGQALNSALSNQFQDGVLRKVVGIINKSVLSLLGGAPLLKEDYEITNPKSRLGRIAEFTAKLSGLENPLSYLPEDVFNINRTKSVTNGKVTYIGSDLSYKEQVNLLLQYTGKGQERQLLNLLDLNIYKNEIEGRTRTIRANTYADFNKNAVTPLDNSDFIVKGNLIIPAPGGYYEPYGIVSRHKFNQNGSIDKQMFSDGFWFVWTTDASDLSPSVTNETYSIGWVARPEGDNKFKQKSLLYKTQELVNSNESFLDLSKKEYTELIDGEYKFISRGDSTTASESYTDDDGTRIKKGDFFRVWTKERGYNRLDRTLRHRGLDNGEKRSVLNDNGIPNFAPTTRQKNDFNELTSDEVIKRYMFSLENLAWNDHMDDLPECEQGAGDPLTGTRGRIMWFPPYNLSFDDSVTVSWEPHNFIGRGESIYTYSNTSRSGSISFMIPVDHPDIIHTLVGEKTQYWERYFKGDKAVEKDAIKKYKDLKKITRKDLDEIDKIRKPAPPRFKRVPVIIKPKKEVEQKKAEEVQKKEEERKFGDIMMSVYFPNNEKVVPRSILKTNFDSLNGDTTPDSLTFVNLKERNVGYEDGGFVDSNYPDFKTTDSDPVSVSTKDGLKYTNKKGVVLNLGPKKQCTYNESKINSLNGCSPKDQNVGFYDTTNFGLNKPFYFDWQKKFHEALSGKTKVQMSFVGNASSPGAWRTTNEALGNDRAQNVAKWFDDNVKPFLEKQGVTITFESPIIEGKADIEDKTSTSTKRNTFCGICDTPEKRPCKESRRVDISIKDLSGPDAEPEKPVLPTAETIEDVETGEEFLPDSTQDNEDPNGNINVNESFIDPAIINKLVYTECDFFKYLETNQPHTYQTISEKIKYFSPAFHSITPQGFNSRLTFLHQCTRQGESIGMDGVDNIKNLAFGRPPVCILRIGDFFHTKIIIESLTIKYAVGNNITWDLNPEGIGVQPMFADVTMQVKILGGMSLTAPINRLQNALSFNFYANTEMYDARADSVVFEQKFDEQGILDLDATYGSSKSAKIVDGIKLSSIVKFNDADKQSRLSKIRQQSRLTLQNSTDAIVSTEKIINTGAVGSLLDYKSKVGMPLTEFEKIDLKIEGISNIPGVFGDSSLPSIENENLKNLSIVQLKEQNSFFNDGLSKLYTDNKNSFTIGETPSESEKTWRNGFKQFLFSESPSLTDKSADKIANDYIQSYKNVWLNPDKTVIKI
jgi:hypothetical protein